MNYKLLTKLSLISLMVIVLWSFSFGLMKKEAFINPKGITVIRVDDFDKTWKKIDSLERKGLTRSALDLVNGIYKKAKKEGVKPQYIKSILYRLKLQSYTDENSIINSLNELKEEIKTSGSPEKQILHSILAEIYWQYYSQNRYRFYNRSTTVEFDNDNIATWDLTKIVGECIDHFQLSLQDAENLKEEKLENYDLILLQGTYNKNLRQTVYDFLIHRAIDFYSGEEPQLIRPAEQFVLNDIAFLKPAHEFVKIPIKTRDSLSFKYYAISLFQSATESHLTDPSPESLIDIELKRLRFVRANSTSPLKDSIYLQTLQSLEKKVIDNPTSVEISHAIATVYFERGNLYNPTLSEDYKWDLKKALNICNEALKRNGTSVGMSLCQQLVHSIKSKDLNNTVEAANLPNKPFRSFLSYKNVKTVYFRIYTADEEDLRKVNRQVEKNYQLSWEQALINHFKGKTFLKTFSYNLPDDEDFQKHSVEIKMPELPPGEYVILGGSDQYFSYQQNRIIFNFVSVTDIGYIHRTNGNGQMEFYFVSRESGKSLPGVEVKLFSEQYTASGYKMVEGFPIIADHEGHILLDDANRNFYLKIQNGRDFTYTSSVGEHPRNPGFYQRDRDKETNNQTRFQTFYFTDRAIYRPGQTIYFKGVLLKIGKNNNHEIVRKTKVTVEFKNVNYQNVSQLFLETNEYGTFSGSFTAPTSGLNGEMKITDNFSGFHSISVEDYKRPKFEVALNDSKENYRLEDSIHITGNAKSFAGSNLDGSEVKYRVVRNAVFPMWWYYWKGYYPSSPTMEITNGSTQTDENGEFNINFKAIPDFSVARESKPSYNYTIYVDVTDINGETRSTEKTITIGYTAMSLGVDVPGNLFKDEIKPVEIRSTNLVGEFTAARGTISIEKLKAPTRSLRTRQWQIPDKFIMTEEEYIQNFPNDPYKDEKDYLRWPKEKVVLEKDFDTSKDKILDLKEAEKWDQGKYVLEIRAKDKYGEEVKEVVYFTVIDKAPSKPALPDTDWFMMLKNSGQPGEKASFFAGTGTDEIRVLYEEEDNGVITTKEWRTIKDQVSLFSIPITEKRRGNFTVHYTFVKNNELFRHSETIEVPYSNKALNLSFESFRNKLQPGEKENWRIRIKGPEGEKVAAEMVATLYDASLNTFRTNSFDFDIYHPRYSALSWNSNGGFGISGNHGFDINWNPSSPVLERTFEQLNWFGFHIGRFRYLEESLQGRTPGVMIRGMSSFNGSGNSPQGETNGIKISGRVTDSSGEGLPGVNVLIKGTNLGTVTDADGRFSIKALSSRVLVFSFIGYVSQEIPIAGKTEVSARLVEDIQSLQEVVVVGYGLFADEEYKPRNNLRAPRLEDSVKKEEGQSKGDLNIQKQPSKEELAVVKTRTNFNETAFFYPHLETDANGDILINFTIPEALTKWKMLGFAHTKDLKFGLVENEVITQKELMVVPNVPRFFREGDKIVFSAKINNLADKDLRGNAQLTLFDALTMQPVDEFLLNSETTQSFETKKGQSTQVSWSLLIPEGIQAITYKLVAKSGNFSDGEEMAIPVLTNRMLVTETMPLWVRSNQTKTFTLDKLINNSSNTLKNHKLTLEFTSQPAWYAIQALPYLMEYPYECAEQTFSRFYANSIASHIANSDPKIKAVFESWKNTPDSKALLSNLEKNQELKSLLLEETPWVREAHNESERKKRVALLFDLNKMTNELETALTKLKKMQKANGAWPWFDGMEPDQYITQHIVTGLGHLDHLGIKNIRTNQEVWSMVTAALKYLDKEIVKEYEDLKRHEAQKLLKMSDDHLYGLIIQYLYARSYFKDVALSPKLKEAIDYYKSQGKKYWLKKSKYYQGMLALSLFRMEDQTTPSDILKSLKENAINSEEMGMYWKEEWGYCWYQAPVETQSLLIEAFDEVSHDQKAVDDMKVWLLKQKQTQNWKTTKATTEACYALLLRGSNWLANDALVDITVGSQKIDPTKLDDSKPEAGTGYFKTSWTGTEVKNDMGKITVSKKDEGVSWGGAYWQYFEQLDKITPAKTPLALKKQLFLEKNTEKGPVIIPVTDQSTLKIGDKLKVRIELSVDREMEYVHMKDMRASGFEPVNVFSGYKFQDGLGYYESTRDAATNFFFDHLRKGTYVFEYPLLVTHKGDFSNGITAIQSMYAPEFASHSEGVRVKVQ